MNSADICSRCKLLTFKDEYFELQQNRKLNEDESISSRTTLGRDGWYYLPSDGPEVFYTTSYSLTDFFPTMPILQHSSLDCSFCLLLRDVLKSKDTDMVVKGSELAQQLRVSELVQIRIQAQHSWLNSSDASGNRGLVLIMTVDYGGLVVYSGRPICIKWAVEAEPGNEGVARLLGLPPRLDYSDIQCVSWIKDQLKDCEAHKHKLADEKFFPERLLKIQGPREKLRLVLREEIEQPLDAEFGAPKYAALSYCWGSAKEARSQLTLTTSTFRQRRLGINRQDLPPALQDAVTMARALSLPYLWVDALCILQDDPSDWEQQCVVMHKIYGNAFITLCAAASKSCQEVFLEHPCHEMSMPFNSYRHNVVGHYRLRVREIDHNDFSGLSQDTRNDDLYNNNQWVKRGWVFQERVSSPRKVIFGKRQIYFLCSQKHSTMGKPDLDKSPPPTGGFQLDRPGKHTTLDELFLKWMHLLKDYGHLRLDSFTRPSDLLPAISGLAALFHQGLQRCTREKLDPTKEYVAGYWKLDLYRSLLWSLSPTTSTLPKIHHLEYLSCLTYQHHLPSWTNLARGEIHNLLHPHPMHCSYLPNFDALEANVKAQGDNPFGALNFGSHLEIRTKILDLARLDWDNISITRELNNERGFFLSYKNSRLCYMNLDFNYMGLSREINNQDSHYGQQDPAETLHDDISNFQLAVLSRCVSLEPNDSPGGERKKISGNLLGVAGLVLQQMPNSEDFYRMGMFRPCDRADGQWLEDPLMCQLKTIRIW